MRALILIIFLLASLTSCSKSKITLEEVVRDDFLFTGVAVSGSGRIFLNYPKWTDDYKYAVVEVLQNGNKVPFPNEDWNKEGGFLLDHFVCVQSVYVDKYDHLWILDNSNPRFEGLIGGGAKLVEVDLTNNEVVRKYQFEDSVLSEDSYLNDIRIDYTYKKAYITDSGAGGIVVVDLDSGAQVKALVNHPIAKAEKDYVVMVNGKDMKFSDGRKLNVHSDGIAIDQTQNNIYFKPLTGEKFYRIKAINLLDGRLKNLKIEELPRTGALDGLVADKKGNIFLSSIEDNSIKYYSPSGKIMTLIKDERIAWPDSFSIHDDYLYFTTSRIHEMPWFNGGESVRKEPYKVYRIDLTGLYPFKFSELLTHKATRYLKNFAINLG